MPFSPGAVTGRTPADQTALASATYVCNGLGAIAAPNACLLTPGSTGRVLVMISGNLVAGATALTITTQLIYGTGTPLANGVANTGSSIGGQLAWVSLTNQTTLPFSLAYLITGLTAGTTYWFDLQGKASSSTVQYKNLNFLALEV